MGLILRFIPEPWASMIIVGAILFAYIYGNVTGTGSERLKNSVAILTAEKKFLTESLDNAMAIQLRIANASSDNRLKAEELRAKGTSLEKMFAGPSVGRCNLTDTERMRITGIRIGARRNTSAR